MCGRMEWMDDATTISLRLCQGITNRVENSVDPESTLFSKCNISWFRMLRVKDQLKE